MQRLAELWYRPPRLAYALAPLALLYRVLTTLRRALYRRGIFERARLTVPIIVVGNITVGGTGKTPLTIWLAQRLAGCGWHPAVVCRSYGASALDARRVRAADDPSVCGDEAVLLASRLACPVWSGPDRVAAARALLAQESGVDVVVCDDGLQHYALERDCEIAVIDAKRGLGNGLMLPAGPLREPASRLRETDLVVLNGPGEVPDLPAGVPRYRMTLRGDTFRHLLDPAKTLLPADLDGKKIAAIAGIGHPQRFFDHLRAMGLTFSAHPFADHFQYRPEHFAGLDADAVLMTEKDAIKCARFGDPRMWTLPIRAEVSEDALRRVFDRIGAKPPSGARTGDA